MDKNLSMTIETGKIFNGMMQIADAKSELAERLNSTYTNRKLSMEGKQEEEKLCRSRYNEKYTSAIADMKEAILEIRNHVLSSKFEPSPELTAAIDFIRTMKEGGCLSPRLLDQQLSQFKGQEVNLIYMREKLKDCIGADVFDKFTFSGYSRADIDKPSQFIDPSKYFDQLEDAVNKNDNTTIALLTSGIVSRLGIDKSTNETSYYEKRQTNMTTERPPVM